MSQDLYVQSPIGGKNGLDVNLVTSVPIPVFIVPAPPLPPPIEPQAIVPVYSNVTGIAPSTPTTLLTYTVAALKTFYMLRAQIGGSNIGIYQIAINASIIGTKRTWFGSGLNDEFTFFGTPETGIRLGAGDVLTITVEHFRPTTGDFEATVTGLLVG